LDLPADWALQSKLPAFVTYASEQAYQMGISMKPIFQMSKLRNREVM
jgi:hypothetical protein